MHARMSMGRPDIYSPDASLGGWAVRGPGRCDIDQPLAGRATGERLDRCLNFASWYADDLAEDDASESSDGRKNPVVSFHWPTGACRVFDEGTCPPGATLVERKSQWVTYQAPHGPAASYASRVMVVASTGSTAKLETTEDEFKPGETVTLRFKGDPFLSSGDNWIGIFSMARGHTRDHALGKGTLGRWRLSDLHVKHSAIIGESETDIAVDVDDLKEGRYGVALFCCGGYEALTPHGAKTVFEVSEEKEGSSTSSPTGGEHTRAGREPEVIARQPWWRMPWEKWVLAGVLIVALIAICISWALLADSEEEYVDLDLSVEGGEGQKVMADNILRAEDGHTGSGQSTRSRNSRWSASTDDDSDKVAAKAHANHALVATTADGRGGGNPRQPLSSRSVPEGRPSSVRDGHRDGEDEEEVGYVV